MTTTTTTEAVNWPAVWATLRRKWCAATTPARTSTDLAAWLTERAGRNVTKQAVSQWATGSDPAHRRPPEDLVLLLLGDLRLRMAVSGDGRVTLSADTTQRAS